MANSFKPEAQEAQLPVLYHLTLSVVVAHNESAALQALPNDKVRQALIDSLPPGTGVGPVTCTIALPDYYARGAEHA